MAKRIIEEDYIIEESDMEDIADKIYDKFEAKFNKLKEQPELIKTMEELPAPVFLMFVENFGEVILEQSQIKPNLKMFTAKYSDQDYINLMKNIDIKTLKAKLTKMYPLTQWGTINKFVHYFSEIENKR